VVHYLDALIPVMNSSNPVDTSRWLRRAVAWLITAVSAGYFLAQWLAPDGCLDSGGSFDYETWQCSSAVSHPYVEARFYQFVSFWVFLGAVSLASALSLRRSKRRQ
jgi:hypothetical protein